MRRHPVSQLDLLLEVINVRTVQEPATHEFGAPGCSDGENGNGFPLINREIDTGVI